ncbi:hypothetical protein V6U90_09885 [Micromonospora sp. CPCC 206060]|uniref:hypothetical protein n=1 Tax=Micromonospora sp. CPCC 206060 TaxID=3122406 RepID=UPI002FF401DA
MADPGEARVLRAGRGWHHLTIGEKTAVLSLGVTVIGTLVGVLAWQLPKQQAGPLATPPAQTAPALPATPGPTTGVPTDPTTGASTGSRVYLDALNPETGAGYLRPLPRALADAGLTHPVTVACPSNNTGDRARSVSYPLRRRYLDFSVTLRPHFAAPEDRESVVRVTAVVGVKQVDDTMTRQVRGTRSASSASPSQPLTFPVEGADELVLTIECDVPDGHVVLVGAELTRR